MIWPAVLAVAMGTGCSDETASSSVRATGGGGVGGEGGEGGEGGGSPGELDWGECVPGEQPLGDGTCLPAGQGAGVPPDGCAEGFESDDEDGCGPILPAAPCPPGQLATPGDTECHELAPCGSSPWGAIPVDTTTQYVDGAYLGGNSDGSEASPWTTIQQGIDAAAPGALVAVAAGTYAENVVIADGAVRLWGRCPAMVTVAGSGAMTPAIRISGTTGSEIRDLAIGGVGIGLDILNADGTLVDRVWVHATGLEGVNAHGATNTTVTGSLVEATTGFGVMATVSSLTFEAMSVRDTAPAAGAQFGRGLVIMSDSNGNRSEATVLGSVIERNRDAGLSVIGSTVTVEATVIRDTEAQGPSGAEQNGDGIEAHVPPSSGEQSVLVVRGSLIDGNHTTGIYAAGTDLTVETTVVRDTQPEPLDGQWGAGIFVVDSPAGAHRSDVTVRSSLIAGNHTVAVLLAGSDGLIESSILSDTLASAKDGKRGRGLSLQDGLASPEPTTATLRGSVLRDNREVALGVMDSVIDVETSRIVDTHAQGLDGLYGRGMSLDTTGELRAQGTIRWSVFERNLEVGALVSAADLVAERSVFRDTSARAIDGVGGIGVLLQRSAAGETSTATIQSCVVENNQRAGIAMLGGELTVETTLVAGTTPDTGPEGYGDGIVLVAWSLDASATLTGSHVRDNSRGGVTSFGATASIGDNAIFCNAFDLNGELYLETPFDFINLGNNRCGCGDAWEACKVLSAGLVPPEPLP